MKITFFASLLILLFSCNEKTEKIEVNETTKETNSTGNEKDTQAEVFDINSIPITTKNLGEFPYFNPPENHCYGYCSSWDGKFKPNDIKDFDKEYFAVNGKFMLLEGKSYKATINKNKNENTSSFNKLIVEKSYHDAILNLGGVQVNAVPVTREEYESINEKDRYQFGASIDANLLDEIKTYVIRTNDKEIWIQFTNLDQESGKITILEKGNLNAEKVTQVSASQLKKDIDQSGKAVLNINFDTDKATLKSDGKTMADEILKLLQEHAALKLSIEGHTDNAGSVEHNKKLSLERATTLKNYLTINGIDENRLKVVGYGQEKPLVANDSESNKAKNRRVELIKF